MFSDKILKKKSVSCICIDFEFVAAEFQLNLIFVQFFIWLVGLIIK